MVGQGTGLAELKVGATYPLDHFFIGDSVSIGQATIITEDGVENAVFLMFEAVVPGTERAMKVPVRMDVALACEMVKMLRAAIEGDCADLSD